MAADSRMTVLRTEEKEEEGQKLRVQQQIVLSDNAYKVVALTSIGVGISVYDAGVINNEPVDSHVHRFEEEAITPEDDVVSCGEKFLSYFQTNHPNVPIGFHVAGSKLEGRASPPFVFVGHTTKQEGVNRVNINAEGKVQYGILRSGDIQVVNRLIEKTQLPLFAAMPLQDAVDYAAHPEALEGPSRRRPHNPMQRSYLLLDDERILLTALKPPQEGRIPSPHSR